MKAVNYNKFECSMTFSANYFRFQNLLMVISLLLLVGCNESEQSKKPIKSIPKIVKQDDFVSLQKAAALGNAEAQFKLASIYDYAEGVNEDQVKAAELYQKSADQGYAKAQTMMYIYSAKGTVIPKSIKSALEWLHKAVAQDDPQALFLMGALYLGETLPAELVGLVPVDKVKALELFNKSAELGWASAQYILAGMYGRGENVEKDLKKAFDLYEKSAAQGDFVGQWMLGSIYSRGDGAVPKNDAKAFELWQKSAAQGLPFAQIDLARSYLGGKGIKEDSVLAYAWANVAASNGVEDAVNLRSLLEASMSKDDLTEAQQLSSSWKKGQVLTRNSDSAKSSSSNAILSVAATRRRTGTLFIVSKNGYAVTNNHVIEGCGELRVDGYKEHAKLITADTVNDLALVKIPGEIKSAADIASDQTKLRQGDDVYIFGFPLNSLLSSSGNLTLGVVSALTGIGNNTNQIQFTAPIQPGSSGSPMLNNKGDVVGVVSAKLSDTAMAKATGSVGQNVNFAISGLTLKTFLDNNSVKYSTSSFFSFTKRSADIADEAKKWTLAVECWK